MIHELKIELDAKDAEIKRQQIVIDEQRTTIENLRRRVEEMETTLFKVQEEQKHATRAAAYRSGADFAELSADME